jgi:hypothetical protein
MSGRQRAGAGSEAKFGLKAAKDLRSGVGRQRDDGMEEYLCTSAWQ